MSTDGVTKCLDAPSRQTKPQLLDPTTQKTEPVFDLATNNLEALVEYKSNDNGLSNSIVSKVSLPAGSHFCFVTSHVPVASTTWSSIQTGEQTHAEFESALVYANHSCEPTLELFIFEPDASGRYVESRAKNAGAPAVEGGRHGIAGEFRVAGNRDLSVGDDLNWFYPSTEFHSPRPFRCLCGAPEIVCIGMQSGAKFLPDAQAAKYFLNSHVVRLREKDKDTMFCRD